MSARDRIIDAAMAIVRKQGVGRLTLDQAAKEAGVSKGGVLYHFKTKDDLIRGMVQRMVDQCDALQARHFAAEPEGPYRWTRALVRSAFDPEGPASDPVGGALLAAVTVNPELIAPVQRAYDNWMARMREDSPDQRLAALVAMAMDGYVFERMMGLKLCDEAECRRVELFALELLGGRP